MALESINHIIREFEIDKPEMRRIMRAFSLEMKAGLEKGGKSSLKMLPTYVRKPTGEESGIFFALDLGGTNFRILEIELKEKGRAKILKAMNFKLPNRCITGDGRELFLYIAGCLKKFLYRYEISNEVCLGFTFSFPIDQTAIDEGRLLNWTKGFGLKGVIGKDVVQLLKEALAKRGLGNVEILALLNDTVGTLVARSYKDPDCRIGIILGTGTNACYSEKLLNIKKLKGRVSKGEDMIINIEWGNFNKLALTRYDRKLDKLSANPGEQILEKMVSGKYLGEVLRLILNGLVQKKFLFLNLGSTNLDVPDLFKAEHISDIENDVSRDLEKTKGTLKSLGIRSSTERDRHIIKRICAAISRRASRVSASCTASIIKEMDPNLSKAHTIAVDGTLYEKHPRFSKNMETAFREIFGKKASRVKMALTKDGSGIGAAIVAAIVERDKIEKV